jgi:2-polyprenyl-3-methyl-5-hydroxy-6-metoxy-1,4-benzoquinol methylase
MDNFNKHKVSWTREKINNFWDYFVSNNNIEDQSYAKEVAPVVIKMLGQYIKKDGNNLDYGCGGGNLMGEFFKEKIKCSGLDVSEKSVQTVKERYEDNSYFENVFLSTGTPNENLLDNSFDFIFSLECLEHLMPEDLEATLNEFYRLLKPGGYVFITVPNNEKLDKYQVMCPDCGCVFHRVQHINSFTEEVFVKKLSDKKFARIFSQQTVLSSKTGLLTKLKKVFRSVERLITKKKAFKPHLVYLGRKK